MRQMLLTLAAAISFTATAFAEGPRVEDFRDQIAASLRAARPDWCIKAVDATMLNYGPKADECSNSLDVGNAWSDVLAGADRSVTVARFVGLALAPPTTATVSADRARLVVVLRPQAYLDSVSPELRAALITRPFAGDLHAVLMLDSPETLQTVSRGALANIGVDETGAFAAAAENLRVRMGPLVREKVERIETVDAGSGLATGGLWLPEACKPDSPERLVLVYRRNAYIVADGADRDAREDFAAAVQTLTREGAFSATPLTCTGGAWRVAR